MGKGYDAGKKVSGIKRYIAVDTQDLPHALAVTTADVTDRKGCLLALKRELDNLGAIQKILADGGYAAKTLASLTRIAETAGNKTQFLLSKKAGGSGKIASADWASIICK